MENSKTILITGASSGFGEACARLLAAAGHRLILVARRVDRLKRLADELKSEVHVQVADVTKKADVKELFETLPAAYADVDVLINNAGLAAGLDLAQDADLSDWEAMIDTNNKGLVYCTHFALQVMKKRNSGHIVNVGSIAGSAAYPRGNVYGASKAFVRQFSRNLRADLAGTDIRVSCVEPGAAETEFSLVRFKGDKEKADAVYAGTRALQATDIADTIKWIIDQPLRVNIDNIEIMPIDQTYAGLSMHRK